MSILLILVSTATYLLGKSQNNINVPSTISPPSISPISAPSPTPDPTVNWKTYNSSCGFAIKYPSDWTAQKYFIQDSNDSCLYITAPDYQSSLDTRKGLYLSASRTIMGSKTKNITIKSLDDYIAMEENISEPPTQVKNKQNKIYGLYQGKQFELGLFELQTEFIFTQNNYIYSVAWPTNYSGAYKNSLDQILSTFKFLDEPQQSNSTSNSNTKIYQSPSLKVSFNYSTQTKNKGEITQIKEVGDKIYVYSSTIKDYTQGQWVEVFTKEPSDSLSEAIQQRFLKGYSLSDCFVASPTRISGKSYPSTYQTATIDVPHAENDDLSTLSEKWQKCPEPYVSENGISYFLEDTNRPDKFVYFSIGQYAIDSGISNLMWQDTIKFL